MTHMKVTHKIEYSAEHVHVVFDGDIDTETCFLWRNHQLEDFDGDIDTDTCFLWRNHQLEDFDRVRKNGVVKYYNGNEWVRISAGGRPRDLNALAAGL